MQRLHLATFLALVAATSAAQGQTSCTDLHEETACTSPASDTPVDGRVLLQMAVEKPASSSAAKGNAAASGALQESRQLPVESHWHSLLQGWASKIVASSHLSARALDDWPIFLGILTVLCCAGGIGGLYVGSMMRSSATGGFGFGYSRSGPEQRTLTGPSLTTSKSVLKQPRPDTSTMQATTSSRYASPPYDSFCLCPNLVVPEGVNSVLLLNFLEAKPGACSDRVIITDQQGGPVLGAYIDRPSPGNVPKTPVVVLTNANQQEVAKCFLRPGKNGLLFELCNKEGRACAVLSLDKGLRDQQWTLRVTSSSANALHVTGQISNTLSATIRDAQGELQAEAEPVQGFPFRAKVRVLSNVDSGLVLCTLLGMGELASSLSGYSS